MRLSRLVLEHAHGQENPGSHLEEPRGVFTTLYLHGKLRGCVGYVVPVLPLHRAVFETARAAASRDSRFTPVTPDEVGDLQVSLSILSPLFPIEAAQVEIGRHGLVVTSGANRGLLLPQVPVEHGWSREEFLEQTCRKAGLYPRCLEVGCNARSFHRGGIRRPGRSRLSRNIFSSREILLRILRESRYEHSKVTWGGIQFGVLC